MKFYLNDYLKPDPPAVVYSLEVYRTGDELSDTDIYSIHNTLKRYQKRYSYVSYLLVISRKGYKQLTCGKYKEIKVARHVHIAAIGGIEESAYQYMKAVKKAVNKRFRKKVSKIVSHGKEQDAIYYINYCFDQAERYRTGGKFDFRQYRDNPLYCKNLS